MRFLHTADWQLGMGRHFLDREHQGQFDAARRDVLGRLGLLAQAEGCEAVVVCGDVFETNQVSARTVRQAMEKLRGLSIPFYLLPGNHDPLNAGSIWTSERFLSARPENVHVLIDTAPVTVRPGFEIVAAPWTSKVPTSDLVGDLCTALDPAPPGVVRVAVGHGTAERFSPEAKPALVREAPLLAALDAGKVHYVALGDRHSATELAPRIWYSGAPEPTAFVEEDPGKVLVVEIDDEAPSKPPLVTRHQVGTWCFHVEDAYLDGPEAVAALRQRLSGLPDKDRTIVKLAVTGTLSVSDKAAYDRFREDLVDVFAAVVDSTSRTELAVRPQDGDFEALGLTGFAAAALDDLRRRAGSEDPQRARAASDALGLLVRLAGRAA